MLYEHTILVLWHYYHSHGLLLNRRFNYNDNYYYYLYRAFPICPKALTGNDNSIHTCYNKNKLTTTNCKTKSNFKAFLKAITDEDCLILSGRSIQYFEADTVNVLSPANVQVTEYVRWRGSLADLNALVGVYKFKQGSKYCGASLLSIL